MTNDTVMFFSFRFKVEDKGKINQFGQNYFQKARLEFQADAKQRSIVCEDLKTEDGYITRHFIVSPIRHSDDHNVVSVVKM